MSVKWSGGSGSAGASAGEVIQIDTATQNIGLNSLRLAIGDGLSLHEMVDGFGDVYTNEDGVDTGSSSGQTYNTSGDYYTGASASTHSLLVQSGGNVASDDITDSTGTHGTGTKTGSADHTVSTSKFGTSSLDFGGGTDGVNFPTSADWDVCPTGAESFTVDLWVNQTSQAVNARLISHNGATAGNYGWSIYIDTSGGLVFQWSTNGTAFGTSVSSATAVISTGTWTHVALVCTAGSAQFYVDGVASGSAGTITGIHDPNQPIYLGTFSTGSTQPLIGRMEEVSVLKGTARVPASGGPTEPYSLSASDMTLLGNTQTAGSAPTSARAVLLYDPIDASTLNTDCTLELSMDGGSTFSTAFTLTKDADYDSNVEILTTNNLTLDSTSGTSIVYRFKTLNSKQQRLHGAYFQWQ